MQRLVAAGTPVSLVIACAALCGCARENGAPGGGMPPQRIPEVIVGTPVRKNIIDYEECTGRTEAYQTVEVRARVTGYLQKVNFVEGKKVKKGDILFEIDARPYDAEMARTEANVVQAEAHLTRLSSEYQRANTLQGRNAISREEFDKIAGDRAEAVAAVGVAKAGRELAKLNLSFTKVVASVDGVISRKLIDEGNLVKADETPLTTIVTQDPMYAYFDVDERSSLRLLRLLQKGEIQYPPVLMGLADEANEFPHKGTVDFVDNRIDTNTGTLHMRCSFPNPNGTLTPGLFVRIRFIFGEQERVILVPEEAIGADQGRKFLFVVNAADQIESRSVKVGKVHDGLRVISEGLTGNERIVINGLQRVRPGIKVIAKPDEKAGLK